MGSADAATFARHYQTNEPIPAELVEQMRRASEFGKALTVRQQMVYARLSLSFYDRDPKPVDTTAIVKELTNKYPPFPYVDGTHFQASFGHLDGYSAVYYTYMWSLVIAKDMFSQFDPDQPARTRRRREVPRDRARPRRIEAGGGAGPRFPRPPVRFQSVGGLAES